MLLFRAAIRHIPHAGPEALAGRNEALFRPAPRMECVFVANFARGACVRGRKAAKNAGDSHLAPRQRVRKSAKNRPICPHLRPVCTTFCTKQTIFWNKSDLL
jgi:hypothetical protein